MEAALSRFGQQLFKAIAIVVFQGPTAAWNSARDFRHQVLSGRRSTPTQDSMWLFPEAPNEAPRNLPLGSYETNFAAHFLRAIPASPSRPVPRRRKLLGSGVGVIAALPENEV